MGITSEFLDCITSELSLLLNIDDESVVFGFLHSELDCFMSGFGMILNIDNRSEFLVCFFGRDAGDFILTGVDVENDMDFEQSGVFRLDDVDLLASEAA